MEALRYFLEFTFSGFWTFLGVLFLMGALSSLIKAICSIVPDQIGGTRTIIHKSNKNNTKDSSDD